MRWFSVTALQGGGCRLLPPAYVHAGINGNGTDGDNDAARHAATVFEEVLRHC